MDAELETRPSRAELMPKRKRNRSFRKAQCLEHLMLADLPPGKHCLKDQLRF